MIGVGSMITIGIVLLVSLLIGYPDRELDHDHVIIPMIQNYINGHNNNNISSSNNRDSSSSVIGVSNNSDLLKDTVIVITGASNGIGLSITKLMCQYGATVIGLGRSSLHQLRELQTSVCYRDNNINNNGSSLLHIYYIDQSNLSSVADVGYTIRQKFPIIHILVNNAGIHNGYIKQMEWPISQFYSSTPILKIDNNINKIGTSYYDQVFVVNYLSHVLLTEILMDSLIQAQQQIAILNNNNDTERREPRIIHTSSTFHWGVNGHSLIVSPKKLKNLSSSSLSSSYHPPYASLPGQYTGHILYRGQQSYSNSKLAQLYHTRAFNYRRKQLLSLQQDDNDETTTIINNKYMIRMVSFCPTWVGTSIGKSDPAAAYIMNLFGYNVNGWGISSALHAMFDTIQTTRNTSLDYVTNTKFPWWWKYTIEPLIRSPYIRYNNPILLDIIIQQVAGILLMIEKFHAGIEWVLPSYDSSQSPDSMNITIALNLYDWSYQTIQPYLKPVSSSS